MTGKDINVRFPVNSKDMYKVKFKSQKKTNLKFYNYYELLDKIYDNDKNESKMR